MNRRERHRLPPVLRIYPYAWVYRTWFMMMFPLELFWRAEAVFRPQARNRYAPGFIQPRMHVWRTDAKYLT